jgi:hypothetical protein
LKTALQKGQILDSDRPPSGRIVDATAALQLPDTVWTHGALPGILEAIPVNCESLVDLGCGRGIIGALCRIYRAPRRLVGVDGFEPYLAFCKQMGFYDETFRSDLRETPLPFRAQEFHVATCIEVIEHLPKDAGKTLLDELERIASCVIVATPGIWFEQDNYDGNILQRHLSLWRTSEFRDRGYQVWGVGALSIGYQIRSVMSKVVGKHAVSVAQSEIRGAARRVSEALGPLTRSWPQLSTKLLCVKTAEFASRRDGDS